MARLFRWLVGIAVATSVAACALATSPGSGSDDDDGQGIPDAGPPARWPDAGTPGPRPDAGDEPDDPDDPDDPIIGGDPASCETIPAYAGGFEVIKCVPEGFESETTTPVGLVISLHGYTQSAASLQETTEWAHLAGRYGFYVVFPHAAGDRAWFWYTFGRSRGQSDPAGLVAVVDRMKEEHNIDPDRVFVSGMSAGGYMAVNLLADYPDVFAGGSATSGGAHGCSALCASSPSGGTAAAVIAEYPEWWNDASARKPRLMLLHGDLDEVNLPGNSTQLVQQWTAVHGADTTPDNAALGLPATLNGYPYEVYAAPSGDVAVAHVHMTDLGHGTPVNPGEATDQGGFDPMPSKTADSCAFCAQDWTNTGSIYGPYYEAAFFGLVP
jgi:poly(hydroxyalkanoate) depolymerase family esterase